MENQSLPSDAANPNAALITTFCEITSAAPAEALFYLESHNFDLSSAVSTFLESNDPDAQLGAPSPNVPVTEPEPYSPSQSKSQSSSPSRSRSPSPPPGRRQQYNLRSSSSSKPAPDAAAAGGSRRIGVSGVRTLSDLNRRSRSRGGGADTDSDDEPQEYYTGGEKSGMLVQDPSKADEVDEIFSQAWQSGGVESLPEQVVQPSSSSGRFTGTARLLSGETVSHASPQQQQQAPASVVHTITFWRNGFTVEDGPLRRLDDPENASFLESIKKSECPVELMPTDRSTAVHVNLVRKEENYVEPKKPRRTFEGVGRTIGGESDGTLVEPAVVVSPPITTAPPPTTGLVVDQALPSTSIQLRLADGTRMVSRFNYHHTLRDIRGFIDASRPGGLRDYQLRTVGFPPKQLTDLDQTVEQAGLANSVVIQKLC